MDLPMSNFPAFEFEFDLLDQSKSDWQTGSKSRLECSMLRTDFLQAEVVSLSAFDFPSVRAA